MSCSNSREASPNARDLVEARCAALSDADVADVEQSILMKYRGGQFGPTIWGIPAEICGEKKMSHVD